MNNTDILTKAQQLITEFSFYWQISAIAIVTILTISFYNFASKFLFPRIKAEIDQNIASSADKMIIKYLQPLIMQMLFIIFLSIGTVVLLKFDQNILILTASIKISFLVLFIRFLKISFNHPILVEIATFILVPILILSIFDLLAPTINYLDSYNFVIGSVRLSIYSIIKTILMLVIIFWGSGILSTQIKKYVEHDKTIKLSTKGVLSKIIDLLIYFTVFLVILKVIGIDSTTFAFVGGALGVGIGFGMQKIVSNFIGGIILLFEKSIKVGDLIEMEDGTVGNIAHFGGRYVLVETLAGKEIMVPNELIVTSKVTNLTHRNAKGRIEIEVTISYKSEVSKAMELMTTAAQEYNRCLRYPTIATNITEFKDYGIELKLFFWINDVSTGRMEPKSIVMLSILEKFAEHNIAISYPKMDNIKNEKPKIFRASTKKPPK